MIDNKTYQKMMSSLFKDQNLNTQDDAVSFKKNTLFKVIQDNVKSNLVKTSYQDLTKAAAGMEIKPFDNPLGKKNILDTIKAVEEKDKKDLAFILPTREELLAQEELGFTPPVEDTTKRNKDGVILNKDGKTGVNSETEEQENYSYSSYDPRAFFALAGLEGLTSVVENFSQEANNKRFQQGLTADGIFTPQEQGDASRGDYNPNTGMFRPDDYVPTQFKGNNMGRINMGYYDKGGPIKRKQKEDLLGAMKAHAYQTNEEITDKLERGYRKNIDGSEQIPQEQAANALFKNQYGNKNYFAQKYNEYREFLESRPDTLIMGNSLDTPTLASFDPDDLVSGQTYTAKDSRKKARMMNKVNRQYNLGYQKIGKDAFIKEGKQASFDKGGPTNSKPNPQYSNQLSEYKTAQEMLKSPANTGQLLDRNQYPDYYSPSPTGLQVKNVYKSNSSNGYFYDYEAPQEFLSEDISTPPSPKVGYYLDPYTSKPLPIEEYGSPGEINKQLAQYLDVVAVKNKFKKQNSTKLEVGGEVELSDEKIRELLAQGYELDILD